jgi:Putative ATPase subunit of terminase (gpP-like)
VPVLKFSVFQGYPAELIAQWCGVDPATAALWKQNKRKASRQALRLFTLHRDGRILGDAWRGWAVRDGQIFDPDGNGTTEPQLRGYWIMMQYAAELARRDPQEQDRFFALLAQR